MMSQQPKDVKALIHLLNQKPPSQNLEITILPLDDDDDFDDEDATRKTSFLKDGIHFGIHAPHIPRMAREFRTEYHALRRTSSGGVSNVTTTKHHDDQDGSSLLEDTTCRKSIRFQEAITCLLLLCPDHATAWADRRHLLRKAYEKQETAKDGGQEQRGVWFQEEIQFLDFLFTQHSKA